jgi:hypothetical protein
MSKVVDLEPPICEFCGEPIVEDRQVCSARDDGRCLRVTYVFSQMDYLRERGTVVAETEAGDN